MTEDAHGPEFEQQVGQLTVGKLELKDSKVSFTGDKEFSELVEGLMKYQNAKLMSGILAKRIERLELTLVEVLGCVDFCRTRFRYPDEVSKPDVEVVKDKLNEAAKLIDDRLREK